MTAPIGFYVNCDDAECADCHRPEDWQGFESWDEPIAIFSWTEADAPTHCHQCGDLIPHGLTTDGLAYVRGRIVDLDGPSDVLVQWLAAYGLALDVDTDDVRARLAAVQHEDESRGGGDVMSAPIGYNVTPDEAECVDCHRPEDWLGWRDWEAPVPIFYGTVADSPLHCGRCWALVPHALTTKGEQYVRERLTSGAGHPEVLAQWYDAYGDLLGLDDWNRSRADAGGHARITKVVVPPMGDTYWFPHEDGQTLRDVALTVHWSPYSPQMFWVSRPFAPASSWTTGFRGVQYPGRDYAHNRRHAARIATELFTTSYLCLWREHDICTGRMAEAAQWPEAPACQCSCHEEARP